jgi:hypothetical protein
MCARHCLLAVFLCLTTLSAFAQTTDSGSNPAQGLRAQMSAEEFKAAGLDKLSDAELTALDAWLNRKVQTVTTQVTTQVAEKAKEEGRKEVVEKNRGFFDFGSSEAIVSNIVGEFSGFGRNKTWILANGQQWQQTDDATLAGVRKTEPKATIKPGVLGVWWMKVEGYNTQAKVRRVK